MFPVNLSGGSKRGARAEIDGCGIDRLMAHLLLFLCRNMLYHKFLLTKSYTEHEEVMELFLN